MIHITRIRVYFCVLVTCVTFSCNSDLRTLLRGIKQRTSQRIPSRQTIKEHVKQLMSDANDTILRPLCWAGTITIPVAIGCLEGWIHKQCNLLDMENEEEKLISGALNIMFLGLGALPMQCWLLKHYTTAPHDIKNFFLIIGIPAYMAGRVEMIHGFKHRSIHQRGAGASGLYTASKALFPAAFIYLAEERSTSARTIVQSLYRICGLMYFLKLLPVLVDH